MFSRPVVAYLRSIQTRREKQCKAAISCPVTETMLSDLGDEYARFIRQDEAIFRSLCLEGEEFKNQTLRVIPDPKEVKSFREIQCPVKVENATIRVKSSEKGSIYWLDFDAIFPWSTDELTYLSLLIGDKIALEIIDRQMSLEV